MIFKLDSNEIEIISEDPMEAKYLESFFINTTLGVNMQMDLIRQGFHVTNEECVSIKINKGATA